jgi:hypothetical protein
LKVNYSTFKGWDDFFDKHGIIKDSDKKGWEEAFGNSTTEAEKSYTNALTALEGFPWSFKELSAGDQAKINQAKNPDDIKTQQKEVAWDQFFRVNEIEDDDEKGAWKEISGLENIVEARKVWANGWKLIGPTVVEGTLTNKTMRYVAHGYNILVDLIKHRQKDVDKFLELARWIKNEFDINNLPTNEEIVFDDDVVPEGATTNEIEKRRDDKKSELFKTAFEGKDKTHELSDEQITKWLETDTGLAKNGTEERTVFNNGWTDPTQIIKDNLFVPFPHVKYPIRGMGDLNETEIEVDIKKVKKVSLDSVHDLLDKIRSKTSAGDLPENYADFSGGDIDNLPEDDTDALPTNYKKSDIINLYNDYWSWLVDNDFVKAFCQVGGEAADFANDHSKRDAVLAYRKESTNLFGDKNEITGTEAGQIFNNGWQSDEISFDGLTGIIASYLENDWDPLLITKIHAEKQIWITKFKNGDNLSLTDAEILVYLKKGIGAGFQPYLSPSEARQVYENHWAADQFICYATLSAGGINWKIRISTYASHNQPADKDLDALNIDKAELDKVNKILGQISQAQQVSDLPDKADISATKYDEKKVPEEKKYDLVKQIYGDKEIQLDQKTADQQLRATAIQVVQDYWKSLKLNETVEMIAGNDWKKKFDNLKGTAITSEENRLKTLISQAKVQPDINQIAAELNKKPVVSMNELKNSDYPTEMVNLAAKDSQRIQRKNEIIAEITQIRDNKLALVREIITNSQNILKKDDATKEELEKVINDLKIFVNAPSDSAEQLVWEEKKAENQKLLTDLEEKLSKIIPHEPEKEEEPDKPQIPTPPPSPTLQEEKEKFGEDYAELKPTQQEGRKMIVENWKKEENYDRSKTCRHCPQEFYYDKSLEYLLAKQKVEKELAEHEAACSFKSKPEERKEAKQIEWEKIKKTKTRYFYACRKCWGKIELDKGIADWDEAKKQGRADVAYHEEHECGGEGTKKIAVYFSPNQGGNEHADLTYAKKIKENELTLEKDNQGEIYQAQENNKNKGTDWTPWIVGSTILVVGVIIATWLAKKRKIRRK